MPMSIDGMDFPTVPAQQLLRQHTWPSMLASKQKMLNLPGPSDKRLAASLCDEAISNVHDYLKQAPSKESTVLYLAYGSNLSKETFRGKRGIKPLSQINVQVPSLKLTFDLPGIPYTEPCFANSATRDPEKDPLAEKAVSDSVPLLHTRTEHHKDRWHKGLIGVVYEVTPEDYAHIIATEGGGASYHDILVDCHPLESSDPNSPVSHDPIRPPFKAHTLFAPARPKEGDSSRLPIRPDSSYAQPSARYLKLITDGAWELELPYEYQDYLKQIRPYTLTTNKQRMGQFIFLGVWMPIVLGIFSLGKVFADEKGRLPKWLRWLTEAIFGAVWQSYDSFFKPLFGDGERTLEDGSGTSEVCPAGFRQNKGWEQALMIRRQQPLTDLEKCSH
ncbi:hypothetical protein K431DRAFT_288782 [Polychaeton citri CBS 116435]|uniref:gamma-glutamylcyclotransferase n=1 Tax=Polychaeton citri CBS 116435 TaxID=1314669 RepID=A0A9P4Q0F0_9PEZI|nr:hypothetical protein K431DRAFT_288782 [Polychaeton citri CBS 116435]